MSSPQHAHDTLSLSVRRGLSPAAVLILVFLLSTIAGGGVWWWSAATGGSGETSAILHAVERSNFSLSITERGEVQSSGVTEVRSLVKSKNTTGQTILRIVPEGTLVSKGDFLVELDSSALEAERTTQRIVCNTVEALVIEASNLYETALIAKREYLEGTYLQERQTIESEVFVAEENLNRAKEYYEYSKKMAVKGYVKELQLEADKFAVAKSAKELEAAQTKLKVLDEFTKAKMVKEMESNILIAKAKWEAEKKSYELETAKLAEIEDQIAKCTILAPTEGVVMYAHERDRRGDSNFIVEDGAIVRERQAIINLPDPTSMQVELMINESLVQFVDPGLKAKIFPVGMGDLEIAGHVISINQYAEPTGWRKANVKEYKAFVKIDNPPPGLRAGMTAGVTVECAFFPDVLQVPVQAVHAHGPDFYCLVYAEGSWEAHKVVCGPTNDKFFVIQSGLEEGDQVAMNPRRFLDQVELPELPPDKRQRAVPQPSAEEQEDSSADS